MNLWWLCKKKAKYHVIKIHLLGTTIVCTKLCGNPYSRCGGISQVKTLTCFVALQEMSGDKSQ